VIVLINHCFNSIYFIDNEIYTPKGNVRLNFVDHGENFANGENGMAELTDRVKQNLF
jgi:hypothetical protein